MNDSAHTNKKKKKQTRVISCECVSFGNITFLCF